MNGLGSRVGVGAIVLLGASCQRTPAPPPAPTAQVATAQEPAAPAAPVPAAARPPSHHGAPLGASPSVGLGRLLADPRPYVGKTVTLEAHVRQACARKGCWMELASSPGGPGVRVRFKDYGFFVPTDAAGATARVEGEVQIAELSEARAKHWESEGAQIFRGPDGKAREVQVIATGVALR